MIFKQRILIFALVAGAYAGIGSSATHQTESLRGRAQEKRSRSLKKEITKFGKMDYAGDLSGFSYSASQTKKTKDRDSDVSDGFVLKKLDVLLGPGDYNSTVYADVYYRETKLPVIVFAPGGGIPKRQYSIMGHKLAERGFGIIVLEKLMFVPGQGTVNMVNPNDINSAIEYFLHVSNSAVSSLLDLENILLLGHSFGGTTVMSYLGGTCHTMFCDPGTVAGPAAPPFVPIAVNEHIRAAAAYATSLVPIVAGQARAFIESMNNAGFPYCIITGEGDESNFLDIDGVTYMEGTMQRLVPDWAVAMLHDLDHFSIANKSPDVNLREDVVSTRDREDQIESVVDALAYWFEKQLAGEDDGFCGDLRVIHADVVRCEEEFSSLGD